MATLANLVDKVRVELGDLGKSFVAQFVADGTTNRFNIHYSPLDAAGVYVWADGTDVTNSVSVEESSGVIVFDTVPEDGTEITVSGTYYRYFTAAELQAIVESAFTQHTAGHTTVVGSQITYANLPPIEDYAVATYAVTLALYTLATDASFDIDVAAPDGVSIPRSERYRQLMDMVNARQMQYKDLCVQLGIGMYKIDVFNLRRISKATGRLVPQYKPQEVDDRSYPQRAHVAAATYGDTTSPWPSAAGDLIAYQGRSWSTSLDFTGDYTGKAFLANLITQRGSNHVVQRITLSVTDHDGATITGVARTSGSHVATITSAGHGFSAGDSVDVVGVNTELNTAWVITAVVDTDNFTLTTTATTALALTDLTATVTKSGEKSYTAQMSLTKDQTLRLAGRTYWSMSTVDDVTSEQIEIKGGDFFTERVSEVIL